MAINIQLLGKMANEGTIWKKPCQQSCPTLDSNRAVYQGLHPDHEHYHSSYNSNAQSAKE
jgi:hypothetical protein